MASKSASLLILAALVAAACLAGQGSAARHLPAEKPAEDAVKRPDTFQEGTALIPGIGRYELGTHYIPDIGGLDHSIPAAANGQFIPGADDTWVPNPGFEVPNPFRPGSDSP
ncbi:putative cell wall protein [Hordeum vulgare]|uniref:Cell wall protein n=1 Tax=Hordeum vulgare subsp. vulgare TaxID=112509 RepID=A0A8I6XF72_HORVV|nr:putative cell wall protein [Hordeum vulgare subsp. vulgare]KAE8792477.1 putative cell wall protein [Hordeum vulgare]